MVKNTIEKPHLLSDTLEVMAGYVDCIVFRHPSPEAMSVSNFIDILNTFEIEYVVAIFKLV